MVDDILTLMKILVTGRSGTGKTTLCQKFVERGYNAFDSDRIDRFVGWRDLATGETAKVDYDKTIDKTKIGWQWHHDTMKALVAKYRDLILCGSADNQLEFYDYFDKVFVLNLPPEEQAKRILSRTEHDYGKLPTMLEQIIIEQATLVEKSQVLGAYVINAQPNPNVICDQILKVIYDN